MKGTFLIEPGRRTGVPRMILGCCMLFATLAGVPASGYATTNCVVLSGIATTRPDPEDVPTKIEIGIYVIKIFGILDIKPTLHADDFLRVQWKDPRLVDQLQRGSLGGCKVPLDAV